MSLHIFIKAKKTKVDREKPVAQRLSGLPLLFLFLSLLSTVLLTSCTGSDSKNEAYTDSDLVTGEAADGSPDVSAAFDDILTEQEEKNASLLVMTINNDAVYADEALYYIAYYEEYGQSAADYYNYYNDTNDYWDAKQDEEGHTARDIYKVNAYTSLYYYNVLSAEAKKAGYALTAEDEIKIDSMTEDFFEKYTADELSLSGMNAAGIRKALEKLLLASKYSNDLLDDITIDEAFVRESIDPSDYAQIETKYLYLPTQTFDEEEEAVELTDEEKEALLAIMKDALTLAQNGTSFDDIKTAMEADADFTVNTKYYLVSSPDADEAYQNAAEQLNEGEISGIITGNTGYYIIKMIDRTSESAYEEAVAQAIETAQTDAFDAAYAAIAANYTMTLQQDYWDNLTMGTVTILSDSTDEDQDSVISNAGDTTVVVGE